MTDELFADRYKLDRRLGVGGMATVQLAFDTRLERNVAVKLLAEHLAQDASFVSRFRREALAAARLVHPNIVQVFDFGLDQVTARNYIVMEFVDGESCAEILRDHGPLGTRDAVNVLSQACRGLDYAHRNGVVHRDVKPGNLLRSRDGAVKLADFGIAKAAEQSDITKVGSVLGTAAYLSPEQARGENAGPASDLYALGVVAYQLLGGRLPFEAASLTDLARQQDAGAPPMLDELDPAIPHALAQVVARSLERRPEDRFADAAALEQAFTASMRGVAPAEPTGATRVLDDTEATQMLDRTEVTTPLARTQAAPPRRRLEPIPEPPRRQTARAAAAAEASRRKPPSSGARLLRALAVLVLLAAVAVGAYLIVDSSSGGGGQVQLDERIQGDVDQAVQSIQDLISNNTR